MAYFNDNRRPPYDYVPRRDEGRHLPMADTRGAAYPLSAPRTFDVRDQREYQELCQFIFDLTCGLADTLYRQRYLNQEEVNGIYGLTDRSLAQFTDYVIRSIDHRDDIIFDADVFRFCSTAGIDEIIKQVGNWLSSRYNRPSYGYGSQYDRRDPYYGYGRNSNRPLASFDTGIQEANYRLQNQSRGAYPYNQSQSSAQEAINAAIANTRGGGYTTQNPGSLGGFAVDSQPTQNVSSTVQSFLDRKFGNDEKAKQQFLDNLAGKLTPVPVKPENQHLLKNFPDMERAEAVRQQIQRNVEQQNQQNQRYSSQKSTPLKEYNQTAETARKASIRVQEAEYNNGLNESEKNATLSARVTPTADKLGNSYFEDYVIVAGNTPTAITVQTSVQEKAESVVQPTEPVFVKKGALTKAKINDDLSVSTRLFKIVEPMNSFTGVQYHLAYNYPEAFKPEANCSKYVNIVRYPQLKLQEIEEDGPKRIEVLMQYQNTINELIKNYDLYGELSSVTEIYKSIYDYHTAIPNAFVRNLVEKRIVDAFNNISSTVFVVPKEPNKYLKAQSLDDLMSVLNAGFSCSQAYRDALLEIQTSHGTGFRDEYYRVLLELVRDVITNGNGYVNFDMNLNKLHWLTRFHDEIPVVVDGKNIASVEIMSDEEKKNWLAKFNANWVATIEMATVVYTNMDLKSIYIDKNTTVVSATDMPEVSLLKTALENVGNDDASKTSKVLSFKLYGAINKTRVFMGQVGISNYNDIDANVPGGLVPRSDLIIQRRELGELPWMSEVVR